MRYLEPASASSCSPWLLLFPLPPLYHSGVGASISFFWLMISSASR
jgi:hypothetical protein